MITQSLTPKTHIKTSSKISNLRQNNHMGKNGGKSCPKQDETRKKKKQRERVGWG